MNTTQHNTTRKNPFRSILLLMLLFGLNITVQAQWNTGGNSFTTGNCIKAKFGTTNNTCDVQFISNGIERMRLTSDGYFGIGTSTPLRPLHVNGNIRFENLPSELRTTAVMMDANGDLSTRTLSIANWNTAYSWGDHAGLYRPISWVPDWTDITNKPFFATVATSGSYTDLSDTPAFDSTNWNTAYSWGNHASAGYLTSETDPVWISDSANYYTKSMLQTPGLSQVHYDNLIGTPAIPADISDLSDNSNLLFDGNWSSLTGTAPDISTFNNDAGYITNPDDADHDPTNELQSLSLSANALELENGGSVQLGELNYWTKTQEDELYYQEGNVGIGLDAPASLMHIHSPVVLPDVPIADEENVDISPRGADTDDKDLIVQGMRTKSIARLQLTNHETGISEDDGLLIKMHNNNASIYNQEDGSLSLLTNEVKLKLEQSNNISITGGNLAMNDNQIRFRGNGDQNHRINYTNENDLDGLHIQGNRGVEIATEFDGTVMTVRDGKVGIGLSNPREKLTVKGKILSEENIVVLNAETSSYPDYVFEDTYNPISLYDLDDYISKNKHLPEIPTAEDVQKEGMKLGEMNTKLLKKIEEITLYTIEQQKTIDELKTRIEKMEEE